MTCLVVVASNWCCCGRLAEPIPVLKGDAIRLVHAFLRSRVDSSWEPAANAQRSALRARGSGTVS